jgi:hypothetical protein
MNVDGLHLVLLREILPSHPFHYFQNSIMMSKHNPIRRSLMARPALQLVSVFLFSFVFQACLKLQPDPFPITTVTPMQAFITKYNIPLSPTDTALFLTAVDFFGIPDQGQYDQAELGYAFRTSAAGVVFELGTLLPSPGFVHTVTIWDSATQTVLGPLNVTNLSSSSFAYAGLDSSTAILLQANHGYVIGVNSTAVGNPVNSSSVGNNVYAPNGLYVDQGAGSDISLLPFTEGTITVERGFIYNYGFQAQPASFFPPPSSWQSQDNGFLGICDFGFAR